MSWLGVMRPVSDWDTSWRETKELAYWNDRGAVKMAINRGVVEEAVGDQRIKDGRKDESVSIMMKMGGGSVV